MSRAILGTRIRERRRSLGITQADLARRIGISPSYLNLIERNKRSVAGNLLRRAADALDLRLDELDGAAERRLFATLDEIAHLPEIAALGVEAASIGELIGRYPGWARALAALARSERAATAEVRALADRITHDPVLAETVHRMLTRIAAIRSAGEILSDYADMPAEQRDHFVRIVADESHALTEVAEAMSAYFDRAQERGRALTPVDEVEALYEARDNRFDEIEAATGGLAVRLAGGLSRSGRAEAARALAAARLAPLVDAILDGQPEIETVSARSRARTALVDYAAGAILVPLAPLAAEAAARRYDIEALAEGFSVEVATLCRRLLALPGGPRLGYLRANAAGSIVERRGLRGLPVPRYGAACPLWVLFRAQQAPERVLRQRAAFPTGERFVFLARAHAAGRPGFGQPQHYLTDMLAMTEADARQTVYAPDPAVPVEEVGPTCAICPRPACPHRIDDPIAAPRLPATAGGAIPHGCGPS